MWPRDAKCGSLYLGFRYNGFVISGFSPLQIAVILTGPKVLRYNRDLVISGFVISVPL